MEISHIPPWGYARAVRVVFTAVVGCVRRTCATAALGWRSVARMTQCARTRVCPAPCAHGSIPHQRCRVARRACGSRNASQSGSDPAVAVAMAATHEVAASLRPSRMIAVAAHAVV